MVGSRAEQPRVIVIGGSLGGLNAGLWLRDVGCDVEVFERVPVPLEDRGAGIVLNPATVRYFLVHPVLDLKEISAAANWFRYMNPDGSVPYEELSHYRFTGYGVLYRALLQSLGEDQYHRGEDCIGFEQDGDKVNVRFASGREEQCDLLVFSDGINSTGRRLLLPEIQPQYAGYVAWRGTMMEHELTPSTFDALHEAITYAVLPDSHSLIYPIPDVHGTVQEGRRIMNWLWYRNVATGDELDDLLTGKSGQYFGTSVPPGLVQERHLERLRQEADALPPAFAEMVRRTEEPFIQVVFDLEVPKMVFGRVCLIGDAAFAARPHAAAGTAKAAENAWKLAEAMKASGGDVQASLERWEPGELELGRQLVARSCEAGERLQHGRWRVGEPLSFGLYRTGDSTFAD